MAETDQTKVCPLCSETIKAAAKVCPHCRKAQGRWFFISRFDLFGILAALSLVVATMSAFWFFCTSKEYSPARHKITVLSTQFGVEITKEHTNAIVSGVLTNESNYPWTLTVFQVRFFDATGKTVDVIDARNEYTDLTVLSHSEGSFHLDLYRRKIPEHASSIMTVTGAKAPGLWFNDD